MPNDSLNLLVVEDEMAMLEAYKDNIESFNKQSPITVIMHVAKSLEEAKKLLANRNFDAAIIDLILRGGGKGLDPEGNEIIAEILKSLRFPVFVYSGNLSQLNDLFKENILFRKFPRDQHAFKDLVKQLVDIYQTGITKILGRTGLIEGYLQTIFWGHLSHSIDYWIKTKREKTLLRYILSHLFEHLEIADSGDFESYSPAEFYIGPPIKRFIFTGLILKRKGATERFIILSPPCDLAQRKAESIVVAV